MDCSTADVPTHVVRDSPGSDSSDSDVVPLSELLKKPHSEEKQSRENTLGLTFRSSTKKDRSASDDSSDDEPLIKMKTNAAPAKKPAEGDNTSTNGTNNKKADLNAGESSDNEPLVKIAKVSKAAEKPRSVPPKPSADTKKKESLDDDDDSSDDEPLSELAKKLPPKRQRKAPVMPSRKATPVLKSKRNAARETVNYAESSSDSSDDEPLATVKRKLTKAPKEQKTSANSQKTKTKENPLKDSSSNNDDNDDDDKPLINLVAKKKPVEKNTKTKAAPQGSASRKRRGVSGESSEDEPLINLVKKNPTDRQTKTKTKSLSTKKRNATPKKPRKTRVSESSSNDDDDDDDDDEPLINLISKKKPVKRNTKTKAASRKRRGVSDESSEDEPLINLVKKNRTDRQTKTKTKASPPKKRNTTPKKPRKTHVSGSSSNMSDDEPLIKAAEHPQVTKIVRIILERCDGEETGTTGNLNKTSTDTPIAEKTVREESGGSGESPEEE